MNVADSVTIRPTPRDDWDVNVNLLIQANTFIESLRTNGQLPGLLDSILHEVTWHRGLHASRWVLDNKHLVTELAQFESKDEEDQKNILDEFRASLSRLTKY